MTTKTTTSNASITAEMTCTRPIVFCGPSGVGKGTLIGMLSKRFANDAFGFSVSHTTRSPREGEIYGVHYHFTTIESMEEGIANQKFLEYANVHGRYYGTSIEAVETVQSAGKICILDIDVQGVQNVKKSSLNPYYIFVAPPSMSALESRLRGRATEQEEDIQRRLANAEAELNYGKQPGNFDLVLINDDLTKTFELLVKNIQKWYPHLKQTLRPRPVVFAGPSGVGKGTLIKMLMERFTDQQLGFSVSHTTRKPRDGELDGVHYHFTTVEQIRSDIAEGKFLEHAEVHGNYYGTSIAAVEQVQLQGRVCILDIDVQGVQNVKKSAIKAYYIFLAPPSMEELEKRLRGRGTEDEVSIQKRLKNASDELDYGQRSGNFNRVFINADLQATLQDLVETFQLWYPQLNEIAPDDPPPKNCTCILS